MGQSPCEGFKKGKEVAEQLPVPSAYFQNVYFGSMLRFFKEAS